MPAKAINRDRTHEIKMIWATAKRCGMDSEALHQLNETTNGIHSIAALDDRQRGKLIRELFQRGRKYKPRQRYQPKPKVGGNVYMLITLEQQTLIRDMLLKLGWGSNPKRFEGFCRKILHKPVPRTVTDGQKIIEAFKSMIARDYGTVPPDGTQGPDDQYI